MGRRRQRQIGGGAPRTAQSAFETLMSVAALNPDTPELDVHGMSTQEAEIAVDQFLYSAQHAGAHVVKIIHGVGTGALAQALPPFVRSHPMVVHTQSEVSGGFEAGSVLYVILAQQHG